MAMMTMARFSEDKCRHFRRFGPGAGRPVRTRSIRRPGRFEVAIVRHADGAGKQA
jgi:hypothetical protein